MFSIEIGNTMFVGKHSKSQNPVLDIYKLTEGNVTTKAVQVVFTLKEWSEFVKFIKRMDSETIQLSDIPEHQHLLYQQSGSAGPSDLRHESEDQDA